MPGQHRFARLIDDLPGLPAKALRQGLVHAAKAEVGVVNKNRIFNGIEGLDPLPLGILDQAVSGAEEPKTEGTQQLSGQRGIFLRRLRQTSAGEGWSPQG